MLTSGTYNFSSPHSEILIRDAYEHVGVPFTLLNQERIDAAQRSLNFILQSWTNKGNNLWTIRRMLIGLNANQTAYVLPSSLSAIKTAAYRTSTRNLGGTAFSSAGGIALNAFDGNFATACTQTAPNGYISYNWGSASYVITMVGIRTNTAQNYTLAFEYSFDNINWLLSYQTLTQAYSLNNTQWFSIAAPVNAPNFRIRETGGSTLDVQEIYFNTNIQDFVMGPISSSDYDNQPYKNLSSSYPNSFYLDRQTVNPVVYVWPVPNTSINVLYLSYWISMQDIGSLIDNAEVPTRFTNALKDALVFSLAMKENVSLDKVSFYQQLSTFSYKEAATEDIERVPMTIKGTPIRGRI